MIVEGHTDNLGDKARNLALSRSRAAQVKEYLHDIQQDTTPADATAPRPGRFHNRRVDIVLVNELPADIIGDLSQ